MATYAQGSNLDVDNAAEQLTTTATPFSYECWIKAASSNSTNKIYVGFANTVTAGTADATDGYELSAGEEFNVPAKIVNDVSEIYVIGSTTNLKVFWLAY